jgi:hypothetical protein
MRFKVDNSFTALLYFLRKNIKGPKVVDSILVKYFCSIEKNFIHNYSYWWIAV